MFEFVHPAVVTHLRVSSTREGWHPAIGSDALQRQLLGLDADTLSADEALSALVTVQQQRAALDAVEARLLVRAAGATRVVRDVLVDDCDGDASRRLTFTDEVVDEIAAELHRPHGVVQAQLQTARLLHGPLARTLDELAAGRITAAHATAICDQAARIFTRPLGDDAQADAAFESACTVLQDRVLGHARTETTTQCRARTRRVVDTIDAAAARARRRRARRGCDVQAWGEDDGIGMVMARLPLVDVAAIMARIDAHVRDHTDDLAAALADADPTLGQLRAAAFTRLLGNSTGGAAPISAEIQVVIDTATLAGLTPDQPAWVQVGSGAPAAIDRDDLIRLLTDPGIPCTLRRLVTDPASGALVDRSPNRYKVSDDLAAWIAARDVTCRHPGCTRPAARCDIDHATDYANGGRTTITDTGALCRRHHNRKTHARWRIEDSQADGSCTFISPSGRRYHRTPIRILPEPPP